MKKFLSSLFKGMGIGIAMIIPGVSGGTLAILLNIYNEIIDSINGIFSHFWKSIKTLFPIFLGAVIGFVGLVFPLKFGLSKAPLVITSLFAGLIIGGIPTLYKEIKGKENFLGFIIAFISLSFMVAICFLTTLLNIDVSTMTFGLWVYLFVAGIIIAATLVIPGVSGSMMLMCLGLYYSILDVISSLMTFSDILHDINILLPIALGAVVGFFVISFIMGRLLKNHKTGTYFSILGLVIGSLGSIYYLAVTSTKYPVNFSTLQIVFSVVAIILGTISTFLLEKTMEKKEANPQEEKQNEVG